MLFGISWPHRRPFRVTVLFCATLTGLSAQEVDWQPFAGSDGGPGLNEGAPPVARFSSPQGVVVDPVGNIYTADTNNHSIRLTSSDGVTRNYAGKPGEAGDSDGAATTARFQNPRGLCWQPDGSLVVADFGNHTIRRVDAQGHVTTIAGHAGLPASDDGAALQARFNRPTDVASATDGTLFIADAGNHSIRRISLEGVVSAIAGQSGTAGREDGTGSSARFRSPRGLAIAPGGAIIVADSANHTIRSISAEGTVTTLAGLAGMGGSTDGVGSGARLRLPGDLAVGMDNKVYIADTNSHLIRRLDPDGSVTTLAGTASSWQPDARTLDPGMVTDASPRSAFLGSFTGVDPNGQWTLFIADLSAGDVGTLNSWALSFTAVPEPGAFIPIGAAAAFLALGRTRRTFPVH